MQARRKNDRRRKRLSAYRVSKAASCRQTEAERVCTVQSGQLKCTAIAACLSSVKRICSVGTAGERMPGRTIFLGDYDYEQNESYVSEHQRGSKSYSS